LIDCLRFEAKQTKVGGLTDETEIARDALNRAAILVSDVVDRKDAVILEFAENSGQVGFNLTLVVKNVGEDHVEHAWDPSKVAGDQLDKWHETVPVELKPRVFQGRQPAREGFVTFRRRTNLGDAMNGTKQPAEFGFRAKIEITADELGSMASRSDCGADRCATPAVECADLQDSSRANQLNRSKQMQRFAFLKPTGYFWKPVDGLKRRRRSKQ
jgi:hypothetical protein